MTILELVYKKGSRFNYYGKDTSGNWHDLKRNGETWYIVKIINGRLTRVPLLFSITEG